MSKESKIDNQDRLCPDFLLNPERRGLDQRHVTQVRFLGGGYIIEVHELIDATSLPTTSKKMMRNFLIREAVVFGFRHTPIHTYIHTYIHVSVGPHPPALSFRELPCFATRHRLYCTYLDRKVRPPYATRLGLAKYTHLVIHAYLHNLGMMR